MCPDILTNCHIVITATVSHKAILMYVCHCFCTIVTGIDVRAAASAGFVVIGAQ